MATILHGNFGPDPLLLAIRDNATASEPLLQAILAFVCERVDVLCATPIDVPAQRITPRTKIALRAECSGSWGSSRSLISDFGDGGLALVCGHPHQVGEIIRVSWRFGEQQQLAEVDCEVRHVTGAHIGVRFLNVSPGQKARLLASLNVAYGRHLSAAA